MQMTVDETGRRHGAAAVNHLSAGEPLRHLGRLVDGDDPALVYCDRCVANDAALGIDRDQPIDIGDEQVDGLHAKLRVRNSSRPVMPAKAGIQYSPNQQLATWARANTLCDVYWIARFRGQ